MLANLFGKKMKGRRDVKESRSERSGQGTDRTRGPARELEEPLGHPIPWSQESAGKTRRDTQQNSYAKGEGKIPRGFTLKATTVSGG